jgi:RNA polymerase sigma factor (sigma-70 family)
MECIDLVVSCARDRENGALWTEFLFRYSAKIKRIICKECALRQVRACRPAHDIFGGENQSDLFQAVIVRLIENDCILMRRFSGNTEDDWLAYISSITFSVVCDAARRQSRAKRSMNNNFPKHVDCEDPAHRVLAMELAALCERMTRNLSGPHSSRDRLIFRLYFVDDLSISQIAKCAGLSKSGVHEILSRSIARARRVIG